MGIHLFAHRQTENTVCLQAIENMLNYVGKKILEGNVEVKERQCGWYKKGK